MEVTVRKCGINGEGIAFADRKPVFLPGAFPGDTAICRIKEDNESYIRAQLVKIISPSPCRRKSPCPIAKECGGCALMELKYEEQLRIKRQLLAEALWKYGHVKEDFIRDIRPSRQETGWRSALKLPVSEADGKLQAGMYKTGTNHFVPVDTCIAHDEKLEAVRKTVMAVLREEKVYAYDGKHGLRYLIMRRIDGQISIALITGNDDLRQSLIEKLSVLPEVVSITQSVNTRKKTAELFGSQLRVLYGSDTLAVHFMGFEIQLSPQSFFQLNLEQAALLYETAVSKIDPCGVLAEVYCGVGLMSILAKDRARKVFGIEVVPQAIENANENARRNRVPNCTFINADAAAGLRELLKEREVDALLADPPRSGMDQAMLDAILSSSISKIVYVSCNPSTLGKNISVLKKEYEVRTVIPFDLFPNTPHCEAVAVLTRRGTSDRVIHRKKRKKEKR